MEKQHGYQSVNQTSVAKVSSWVAGVCPVPDCFFITTLNVNNGHYVLLVDSFIVLKQIEAKI